MIQIRRHQKKPGSTAQRPTICHVIHALGVGGAEVLVRQMIQQMSADFRCVVAVLDDIGAIGTQLQSAGIHVEHLRRQPGIDLKCAERLRAFADSQRADILHAHQCTPFFQAMLSRGLSGRRPVVFTEHGRHFPDRPSRRRMIVNRLLLQRQDRIVACGEAVRQALITNEGLPAGRVEVIYNGADTSAFSQPTDDARERIRRDLGYSANDFVVIQVARLHQLKDHQTALRTIERVRSEIPQARLLFVGDGDQRQALQQTIDERQLSANVTLLGTRSDIADLLAAADVFLLTSISEGIPLTVIEAMAARLPVVATSVGGLPEMVQHGETGFLAGSGDDQCLATHLTTLAQQSSLRTQMGDRAAVVACSRFSLESMLNSYQNVYTEVLQGVRR